MPKATSPAMIVAIKRQLAQKRSYRQIADSLDCGIGTVGNVAVGKIQPPAPFLRNRAVDFKEVTAYFCSACNVEVTFFPCVACLAREKKASKPRLA